MSERFLETPFSFLPPVKLRDVEIGLVLFLVLMRHVEHRVCSTTPSKPSCGPGPLGLQWDLGSLAVAPSCLVLVVPLPCPHCHHKLGLLPSGVPMVRGKSLEGFECGLRYVCLPATATPTCGPAQIRDAMCFAVTSSVRACGSLFGQLQKQEHMPAAVGLVFACFEPHIFFFNEMEFPRSLLQTG